LPGGAQIATGTEIDPFYSQLLRDGIRAHERGAHSEAVQLLKLACFGMLDEPRELARGLTHLALAQGAIPDKAGVQATFDRLALVEERFDAYTRAPIPAEERQGAETLFKRFVSPAVLRQSAAFRGLLDSPAPEPPLNGEVSAVSEPRNLTPEQTRRLQEARDLLRQARTAGDLKQPLALAQEVADARPQVSEAQHLAAEIAYRASQWEEAALYFRRGGDPGDDQPTLLFFMAVSLFESGSREEAVALLRRSLPRLQRTPYVKTYAEKILGETEGEP
jgi:tetratricopeptide (TPR) repeat protein